MTARDLYCLAIRIGGLVFLMYAIFDAAHLLGSAIGAQMTYTAPSSGLIYSAVMWAVLGVVVTFLAGPITRLVYGPQP